jgi:predicted ATP-dependent endonuclease of OLD family
MQLQGITVQKFRSITAARKIPLDRMTILVGPNNEGKSNILRALVLAMAVGVKLVVASPIKLMLLSSPPFQSINALFD